MPLINEQVVALVGHESAISEAPDPVERSAIRRFVQASMNQEPAYQARDPAELEAPELFPMNMFVRPFGTPDPLSERADDPDFDGAIAASMRSLPELPLPSLVRLNGGYEIQIFRRAKVGERVRMKSKYVDITERQGSKGPMILAVVDTDYFTADGTPLLRVRNTGIYR
jgi:hypothetical protein